MTLVWHLPGVAKLLIDPGAAISAIGDPGVAPKVTLVWHLPWCGKAIHEPW